MRYKGLDSRWNLSRRRTRARVIEAYGRICACCGEYRLEFLCIDHIDGVKPEGYPRAGSLLYAYLKQKGFPPGFRVLCHNCNMAIGLYGYCPHEDEQTEKRQQEDIPG
jgi:hypothetical protein